MEEILENEQQEMFNSQEHNADFFGERTKKRVSWIVWGCFAGPEKDFCLFWEK
ncbi:unnamed protein product [Blumeria hordei]|uniref:Uncharacterized protein n=1 Tax=Blumeria hordei TaxID=2867405 RepID=A0A383V044_BLUHO|nr:unnamed protein product [Blumeria hordei]